MSEKKKTDAELTEADLDKVTGGLDRESIEAEDDPFRIQLLQDIANERCSRGESHTVEEHPITGELRCTKCGKTWD